MKSFVETLWSGEEKIVIGIDCGTTQSGVAYSYLYPGGKQSVQRVVQWPGQESQKGEAKIPSVVWYDNENKARAFGAEACATRIENQAEDEQWQLAEHFKLQLHPVTMRAKHNIIVQPLPRGVSVERIYADFFRYLFEHTRTFFRDREINGSEIWQRLNDKIEFVLAHPNGWSAHEQGVFRKAAILGGLVPNASVAARRVHFVTEAEASVHFVMLHTDMENRLTPGTDFVVCDAGGSTVDTTLYTVTSTSPVLKLEEKRASACVQAGAIFVDQTATEYFSALFSGGNLDPEDVKEYTDEAVKAFESEAKKAFKGPDDDEICLKVAGNKVVERAVGIRRGILTVQSNQVERFFAPWVEQIIESVGEQIRGHACKYLLLVGGFGDSPYLRNKFRQSPHFNNIEFTLANEPTAKAVADGAVVWFIQQSVVARATRFAFGVPMGAPYNPFDSRHVGRTVYNDIDGKWVRGCWSEIVAKDQVVKEDEERRCSYFRSFDNASPDLSDLEYAVFAYTGDGPAPYFMCDRSGDMTTGFSLACVIQANLSNMRSSLQRRMGDKGPYWVLIFDIAISFGTTELKAAVVWEDSQGQEHRGEATLIPSRFT